VSRLPQENEQEAKRLKKETKKLVKDTKETTAQVDVKEVEQDQR
jgi:hypothetical protein